MASENPSSEVEQEKTYYRFYSEDGKLARRRYISDLKQPKQYEPKSPEMWIIVVLAIIFLPGVLIYLGAIWGQNKYNEHKMNKANQERADTGNELEEKDRRAASRDNDDFDSIVDSRSERGSSYDKAAARLGGRGGGEHDDHSESEKIELEATSSSEEEAEEGVSEEESQVDSHSGEFKKF